MTRQEGNRLLDRVRAGEDAEHTAVREALVATGDRPKPGPRPKSMPEGEALVRLLMGRTREDEDGCALWLPKLCHGVPLVTLSGKPRVVRRILWAAQHGPIRPRHIIVSSCGKPACISCLAQITRSDLLRGIPKPESHRQRITAIRRAASPLADPEKMRLALYGEGTHAQIAAQIGCHKSLVTKVRRRAKPNPFAGLGSSVRKEPTWR